jgi:hypothetical protein
LSVIKLSADFERLEFGGGCLGHDVLPIHSSSILEGMKTRLPAALCFVLVLCLSILSGGQLIPGANTCPTSGAKAVSATSARSVTWTVQAPLANTGKIYIGGPTVTTSTGIALNPGDGYTNPSQGNAASYDLSQVYFACTVSGDSITYVYQQ